MFPDRDLKGAFRPS